MGCFRSKKLILFNCLTLVFGETPLTDEMGLSTTGINGLDEILGGGIPRGHTVSVFGGPGAGKTTFAIQFLYNGAKKYDEPGLYISLDEPPNAIKNHMQPFGWDLEALEKTNKLVFLNASPFEQVSSIVKIGNGTGVGWGDWKRDFSISSLSEAVKGTASQIGAKRIVIDPMSTLLFHYGKTLDRRMAVMDLIRTLRSDTSCTSILILDLHSSSLQREYQPEEFLAQGSIIFQTIDHPENGLTRIVHIEKMRGVDHDTQRHPYKITKNGIQIFANEKYIQE